MADSPLPNAPILTPMVQVLRRLLAPDGCPWDRKQTPASLCDYVIEESFELVEAVRGGQVAEAAEEIGDVLFLLLFLAELYERQGDFRLEEVVAANAAKMIRRHPHVFADTSVATQEELLRNWERIKRQEKDAKAEATRPPALFDSLPRGLPPLLKAYRIHSKAARSGFTWESDAAAQGQFAQEWDEWQAALATGDAEAAAAEFGDLLFCLVELGRRQGIKANDALERANLKFLGRYAAMEELARSRGQVLADLPLGAQNQLWDEVKASGR